MKKKEDVNISEESFRKQLATIMNDKACTD